MGSIILAAAAAGLAAPSNDSTTLTCNLKLADRSSFRVKGQFNKDRLHSNLSQLIRIEGEFTSAPQEIVITSDGTENHRWRLGSRPSGQMFDASLTRYGSEAALLIVERHKFVGRHWGRGLIGAGLCDVRTNQRGEKES